MGQMDIVHIASELAPVAKVGGLADVIYGLSQALTKREHRVRIILPKYTCLDDRLLSDLHVVESGLAVEENHEVIQNTIWSAKLDDLEVILIEAHHPRKYFEREGIYGEEDNNARFLYFCKAASAFLEKGLPDVVHLHDWPTAGAAFFLKDKVRVVLTIHSLYHQGRCAPFNFERLGLDASASFLQDPSEGETLNILRGVIHTADSLTTVSPTYAKEILTPQEGEGLDPDLIQEKKKLKGILNGIDIDYWNPQTDSFLIKNYDAETAIAGKLENKRHVQKHLMLSEGKPLVVTITRLDPQKGLDLIAYGIERTRELGGQFVLLGTTSDPEVEAQFKALESLPDVAICLKYDEPLSHLLYAASDMLLMPSIFEPCGLAQMIALRYGSIPLVRSTGGLKDTVFDGQNGFVFDIPDNKGVASVLERAFEAFGSDLWPTLIQKGMQGDYSWTASAEKYLEVFRDLL